MNIIQIRGTSGSGKSTVMHNILKAMSDTFNKEEVFREGRKKPLYYQFDDEQRTIVLGHYEAACGGCDTIGSAKAVYELILGLYSSGNPCKLLLCEGLLLSEDTKWTLRLKEEGHSVKVMFLTTPIENCLERIVSRRSEVGNFKPLNPDNTTNRFKVIERAYYKLKDAGVEVGKCSSNAGHHVILSYME